MRTSVINIEGIFKKLSIFKMVVRFQRFFLLSVLVLGLVSLTLLSVSRQQSMLRTIAEPAKSNLNEAVQRLLLADELANNDEVNRAAANFDSIMNTEASLSSMSQYSRDVWTSATKIRSLLASANRADAAAEAVNFRSLMDKNDSERVKIAVGTKSRRFDWSFALGIFGASTCLTLLAFSHRSLLGEAQARAAAKDSCTAALLTLSEQFDEERQRTATLQKRLLDVGADSKAKIAEMFHVSEILESQITFLKGSLSTNSEKYHILESHFVHKSNEADLLKSKLGNLLEEFEAQIQDRQAEAAERNGLLQALSMQKINSEAEYAVAKIELAELRASQAKFRATIESDNTVLEWSNKKLVAQVAELSDHIASLKAELASTAMRLRQVLANNV